VIGVCNYFIEQFVVGCREEVAKRRRLWRRSGLPQISRDSTTQDSVDTLSVGGRRKAPPARRAGVCESLDDDRVEHLLPTLNVSRIPGT